MTKVEAIALLVEMQNNCNMPTATDPKRFAKSEAIDIVLDEMRMRLSVAPALGFDDRWGELPVASCARCGHTLHGYMKFCSYCGQKQEWGD